MFGTGKSHRRHVADRPIVEPPKLGWESEPAPADGPTSYEGLIAISSKVELKNAGVLLSGRRSDNN